MNQTTHLILACSALALLTLGVGVIMLVVRVREMKKERIHPQSIALSSQRTEKLQGSRVADNYKNLFELPILFYALCSLSIASQQTPNWLPIAAWLFIVSRVIHSLIQCTYNRVIHRFSVFLVGVVLLGVMWISVLISSLTSVLI